MPANGRRDLIRLLKVKMSGGHKGRAPHIPNIATKLKALLLLLLLLLLLVVVVVVVVVAVVAVVVVPGKTGRQRTIPVHQ